MRVDGCHQSVAGIADSLEMARCNISSYPRNSKIISHGFSLSVDVKNGQDTFSPKDNKPDLSEWQEDEPFLASELTKKSLDFQFSAWYYWRGMIYYKIWVLV
jgi:hypothetical protein